jgi:hypothetical protein
LLIFYEISVEYFFKGPAPVSLPQQTQITGIKNGSSNCSISQVGANTIGCIQEQKNENEDEFNDSVTEYVTILKTLTIILNNILFFKFNLI